LRLYNTLTQKKEELRPIREGEVDLFVCGPTVYDAPHLGHAKTYTQFDLLARYLRSRGFKVRYLQNITDIDDKIIQRSRENGESWKQLARRFESLYREDMKALHNTSVTKYARATDYMDQIVAQVQTLLEKDIAYKAPDGIYYDLSKFPSYGKLSGRTELQEEDSVSRIDESSHKRNWNDFCLWKMAKEDEPSWDTPLGKGRPGWHIEDTAITETEFGPQYDLHGGAVDLIFPHHEAEIAQMEAASGKEPLVRYWVHTGFLNINAKKMSKSKGNFFTLRDTLEKHDYRVLRFFFLSHHYRTTMNYAEDALDQAAGGLQRIQDFLFHANPERDEPEEAKAVEETRKRFLEAMEDDLETPRAFGALFELIRERNTLGGGGKYALDFLKEFDDLFDILDWNQLEAGDEEAEIQALIEERQVARDAKDWARSDALRDELKARGIELTDTAAGVKWRRLDG
jgi:cysteinyl-tRNA synthetase